MVGRARELAAFDDLADRAVEDGAQFVIVSGEAGIGKSTLIEYVKNERTGARWSVHTGHCIEYAERTLPFDPIVGILRSILDVAPDTIDELVNHRRADLSALLPELRARGIDGASLSGDVDRLIDAISTLLIRAADRRPVMLVIEDIHWADAATRDLLASLVHSLGTARVLAVISQRTGSVPRGHVFHTWLAEIGRFPNVTTINLEGLGRDALAEQARNILGTPAAASDLVELERRTGGNAYFSHELLHAQRAGNDALPSSLSGFLTSRIQRLDPNQQLVLRAMAVAGRPIHHRVLSRLLPDIDVAALARQLFDAAIIITEGSDLAFAHALMREAILPDVLPFEAEELHRGLAEIMGESLGPTPSPADLATVAAHWQQANDPVRALPATVRAAHAAAGVAAYESAADLARQALGHWGMVTDPESIADSTRDRLTIAAADWLVASNQANAAADLLDDALRSWGSGLPDGRRALLLAKLAPIRFEIGKPDEAAGLIDTAVDLVDGETSAEAAQVHHRASKLSLAIGSIHPAIESAERAIAIAETTGPETVLVEALTTKALGLGVTNSLDAGVELVREARRRALSRNLVSQVAFTYRTEMMIINYRLGRTEASLQALRDGLAYADRNCGPSLRLDIRLDLALGLVEAGRLVEAGPVLDELLAAPSARLRGLVILQAAALHRLLSGDLDRSAEHLASANALSKRIRSAQETGFQHRLEAELARRHGRYDEALALVDRALDYQLTSDNVTFTRESILEKCRIVRAIGTDDPVRALALRPDVEELVAMMAGADPGSAALSTLMGLELGLIDQSVTAATATAVLNRLSMFGFGAETLQASLIRVELLAAEATNPEEMIDELVGLRSLGARSGMRWLTEGANRIIDEIGLAIDLTDDSAREQPSTEQDHGLTAREVEVLGLLARGLTNKEIGAELYVSHRTISTHVSNLLAKLHLKNRSEAAAAYHRLGFASADL
jgi:DNA-binding CsgD family transcriptional regulator/tetratricopeptide (TPR) repeat protein